MKKQKLEFDKASAAYREMKKHLYSGKPVLGADSPFSELLEDLVNGMLEGEMDSFLSEERAAGRWNKRNGHTGKNILSSVGRLEIETPRDRKGDFSPSLIGKREVELNSGLDEQILALYAQGNSYEDVRRLLSKLYGVSLSSGKISAITDKVLPVIDEWRNRPLKPLYAVVYMDAMYFKVRQEGKYSDRAFYTVYAIDMDGNRDLLGLYIQGCEGAKRWAVVLDDLRRRGVEDIIVACTDDLNGFSEAVTDGFPSTVVQKCVVHMVRNSLRFVDDRDAKAVAADLRKVYTSDDREQAMTALETFRSKWDHKYGHIGRKWMEKWDELVAFMDFPDGMRKMVYTTNPVEALHRIVRKLIKSKAAWVSDTALTKQVFLSLMHNEKSWKKRANGWKQVQRNLIELYPERIAKHYHK